MAEEKPRLARLTAIITQLQSKKIVTAKDIATKHGVSIRTVYRDIRTLEQSGIPIVTEEGKGYSIMEGYKLPPVMFTEEEANALITAEQLILRNKDQSLSDHYHNAIIKIRATLKNSQQEKSELLTTRIQIRNNLNNAKTSKFLIQLQSTITDFRVVKLTYFSLDHQLTERLVEPFALYTTNDNWVLIAFCRKRNDFRSFRLDCIQQMQITQERFEPQNMTLQQYMEECQKKWFATPDIPLTHARFTFAGNQRDKIMKNVKIEPFSIVGIEVRTTNKNSQAAKDIAELWQRFMSENLQDKIPNKTDTSVYSVYTDYEGDHTQPYTALLGCKVENLKSIPAGMTVKTFAGGEYVKITAKGDLMKGLIVSEWTRIWSMELNRAFTADFEVYGPKAQNPANAEVDFYIAVK